MVQGAPGNVRKQQWWELAVFIAAVLVYANSLFNGFVWDDHVLIEGNPFLDNPARILSAQGSARPVVLLSFLWDRTLWGSGPFGAHLTNVLLHGINSVLVSRLAFLFLGAGPAVRLSGLVFALHPIHTEAINGIAFRADLLAALFTFLSLWAYLIFREEKDGLHRTAWLGACAASYALGLFSKEMAITLPALILLYETILGARHQRKSRRGRNAWGWAALGLSAAIALGYLGFRAPRSGYEAIAGPAAAYRNDGVVSPSPPQWRQLYQDPGTNFMTMSGIFADYFRLMIVPHPLRVDRSPPILNSIGDWKVWIAWLALAGLLCAAILAGIKGHPLAWGIGWCFITLLPVSNIIPIYNPVAERYLYLVSAGAVWALGYALRQKTTAACVLLAAYGGLTLLRNRDWKSDESLFGAEIRRGTDNARVYYNMGNVRRQQNRWDEAIAQYQHALSLNPHYMEAVNNLGGIYEMKDAPDRALSVYQKAGSLNPTHPVAYDLMGSLLQKQNKPQEAIAYYRRALSANAGYAPARYKLGMIYADMGDYPRALSELKEAARLDSRDDKTALNLGAIYDRLGDFKQAVYWLEKAQALKPDAAPLYCNLGTAYADSGDLSKARECFQKALNLQPDYVDAHYNLAVIEQKLNHIPQAVAAYEQTLRINPRKLEAWNNLGGLYEMLGDLKKAKEYYFEALKKDPHRPSLHNNLGNIHVKEGQLDSAVKEYLAALRYGPEFNEPKLNQVPLRLNLGLCYQRQGKIKEAARQWRKVLEIDPANAAAKKQLRDLSNAR